MEFITTGNRIAVENFSIGKVYTIVWATGNYKSLACVGKGSDFVMFQDQAPDLLFCLTMDTAIAVESIEEGGGGAGTMNYNELENKPSINGIVLVGNKTGADLNLVSQADLDDYATNAAVVAGLATKQDALSSSQLAAVNSGITSALVTQIGTNTSAIAGKQDALSSSQLAAVNSGITSTDVAQITTNKNNISTVADQTTAYNMAIDNNFSGAIYKVAKLRTLKANIAYVVIFGNLTSTDTDSNVCALNLYNNGTSVMPLGGVARGNNITLTITPTADANELYVYASNSYPAGAGDTVTVTNLMIVDKSLYDAGFTAYQPYAMTNAEITAWILSQS